MKKSNKEKLEELKMESKKIEEKIHNIEEEEQKKHLESNQKLIGKYFSKNNSFFKMLKINENGYVSIVELEFYRGEYGEELELEFSTRDITSIKHINARRWKEITKDEFKAKVIKIVMARINEDFGD